MFQRGPLLALLIFLAAFRAGIAAASAQDTPFFSPEYPAAGVAATPSLSAWALPTPRNPRVVSSDDLIASGQQAGETMPRRPNLTEFGVEFDKRHPDLYQLPADLEVLKKEMAQSSPTPSATPSPSPTPSPTPWRIIVGHRVFLVNPNANIQPAARAEPTPTPVPVDPQPK
jgi:hypothetical protein